MLEAIRPALTNVGNALAIVRANKDRPAGRVRVTAHRAAAAYHVVPRLPALRRDYPEITVELSVSDGLVDIVAEGFDVGIRHTHSLQDDMIAVRLDEGTRTQVVASPLYIKRHRVPAHPRDLLGHACLSYRYTTARRLHPWRFMRDGEPILIDVAPVFVADDIDMLLAATIGGLGLTQATEPQAEPYLAEGSLVTVLEGWEQDVPPNYLYYAGRRHVSPAVRVFIDAMRRPVEAQ